MKMQVTVIIMVCCVAISCARDITKVTIAKKPLPDNFTVAQPEKIAVTNDAVTCTIYAKRFAQGNVAYCEIIPARDVKSLSVKFIDTEIVLSKKKWGYRGFFAIDPDLKPGVYHCAIHGDTFHIEIPVTIKRSFFPVSVIPMEFDKFSQKDYIETPEVKQFIAECTKKKQKAFATRFDDCIQSPPYYPLNTHAINSAFWAKRRYLLYDSSTKKRQTVTRIHHGIDLNGNSGEPVYAVLDGIVVLADKLFYEGNIVIINHGNGIFSYYMHMEKLMVSSGDRVVAGQLIGAVGSTGMSTGPHLHVSLMVHGVQANPLSLLVLPIKK